jgi:hypothetical protein
MLLSGHFREEFSLKDTFGIPGESSVPWEDI